MTKYCGVMHAVSPKAAFYHKSPELSRRTEVKPHGVNESLGIIQHFYLAITFNMSLYIPGASQRLTTSFSHLHTRQRAAQVRRHLSTTSSLRQEIRDAYILSAARTPTGRVCLP